MVITPNSKIILLKSPLKLDNYNQITFASATAQYNYFYGLTKLEHSDFTYVRKDGVIRIPTHKEANDGLPTYEQLLGYNYCMYQNTSYSSKWFYAFITDVAYQNDGMTTISIETDVFQTWQFDLVYMNSFIEREHVSDDTIGANTVPEGLETGDYIINSSGVVSNLLRRDSCYVVISLSYVPDNTPFVDPDRAIGNIYSGLTNLVMKTFEDASKLLAGYDEIGRGDAVHNVYMMPSSFISSGSVWVQGDLGNQTDIDFMPLPSSNASALLEDNISLPINTTIDSYTPKNKKLFCYPYNCLSITNNCGTQAEFRYEDFTSASPSFKLVGLESSGIPAILMPKNYKRVTASGSQGDLYNFGISAGKFPTCSWKTDLYTNWMTQNGVNILGTKIDAPTWQAIGGSAQMLAGAATMNPESIGSGMAGMFNSVQEQYRHSLVSPQINGQTTIGDLSFTSDMLCFTYYKMSIRAEYARIIDDFFSMYGYKVNRLKSININKRTNWDYIKTIDVNLEGNIPEKDLDEIRKLFNNGCTFWHTTQYFLDYSRTNSIVT